MDKKTIGVVIIFVLLMIGVFNMGGKNNNHSTAKTSSSSTDNSSSSSSDDSHIQETITELNNWYTNDYKNTVYDDYTSTNSQALETNYKKSLLIKNFKVSSGDLIAVIDKARMDSENFSQKEMGDFTFTNAVIQYDKTDDLKKFKNFKDGNFNKPVIGNLGNYIEFE